MTRHMHAAFSKVLYANSLCSKFGSISALVSITDNIYIHRLLYAKSLSLNFRKFVVFVTVYARYIHSIFNFFMC